LSKEINIFFEKLSERKYKENDLSDITWALCCQNAAFKNFFVSYCFPNEKITTIKKFEREYSKGKSRPDFHFWGNNPNNDDPEYLIEIKIYYKNELRKQLQKYNNDFSKVKKSFIANYNLSEKINGYEIKTWRGFIIELEKILLIDNKLKNDIIVKGYLQYIKNITDFYEETIMNFSNLNYLYTFYKISEKIFKDKYSKSIKIDEKYKPIDYYYYGFNLKNNKVNVKSFYFWVGLVFRNNNVELAFEIHNCAKEKIDNLPEGNYFNINEEKNWLSLKEKYFMKLCDNINISEQEKILENFYKEIFDIFNIEPDKI